MGRFGPMVPGFGMAKATLEVVEGKGVPTSLKFQFNPTQFSYQKSASWTPGRTTAAGEAVDPTFNETSPGSLTMEIFFDAFSLPMGDVSEDVQKLLTWTRPCPVPYAQNVFRPPLLKFKWGTSGALSDFQGFLSSVNATYTLFGVDGRPIRATCNITLEEVPKPVTGTNPTSGGRLGYRSHVLIEGETLHSVAWAEYRQARYWRALADVNGIDDPLRVPAGTTLILPPAHDAARMS